MARLRVAVRLVAMLGWLALCLPASLFARALLAADPWPPRFLSGIARIAGVTIRTTGTPAPAPALILANHVSWIDIPALASAGNARFVAHDGLAVVPFVRFLCRLNGTIFIARNDRATIAGQIADLRAAMAGTRPLALFPEGTTSDGTGLLPFKSSLLAALDPLPPGLTVQPVRIDYGPGVTAIAWVGEEPGLANFLRILGRRGRVAVVVHFLPPLAGTALTTRKTIAVAARRAIGAG